MIETEYKEAMVKQKTEYINTCKCDNCGQIIWKEYGDKFTELYPPFNKLKQVSFYHVTIGHHDWGNDSCDSIDHLDICPNCICDLFKEYIKRSENGVNTEYIDIEHKNRHSLLLEEVNDELHNRKLFRLGGLI